MNIENNISLKKYNSFAIDVKAERLINCHSIQDLHQALNITKNQKKLILGNGSNVLFLNDFHGTIIRPLFDNISVIDENDNLVKLRVEAGLDFDHLVDFCVKNNLQGLENLSLIPGKVGAAPVQNIGAYGVEVANLIHSVEGFFLHNAEPFNISANDCHFAYRNSIFKQQLKNNTVITHVIFALNKTNIAPNINYGDLKQHLQLLGSNSIANVRQAVINIRNNKLPDPNSLPNAGSFFKNPEINSHQFNQLQKSFPDIPFFPLTNNLFKIPAAWLIEKAGWKGKSLNNCATHNTQPLVIVNLNNASGNDIINLANHISNDVFNIFNIKLSPEVNLI